MSRFIRLLALTLALVCTFISCKKDEDAVYGGKPYSLDGTTWTSRLSSSGRYTVFHFLSGGRYERRILDKNAILIDVDIRDSYTIRKADGRWYIDLYYIGRPRFLMHVNFDEGVMIEQGVEYRKQ